MIISAYGDNFIRFDALSEYERDVLLAYFTKKIHNWFIIKKKAPNALITECFMTTGDPFDPEHYYLPMGLWADLAACAQEKGLDICYGGNFSDYVQDTTITRDGIQAFSDELFAKCPYKPHGYQLDAVFYALFYRKACMEITTNGGKTLICYVLFKYLRDKFGVKRILYITPGTNLTTQTSEKFMLYDKDCGVETNWTFGEITGDPKERKKKRAAAESADIVFGNYQSLRTMSDEFLATFDCVFCDELHHFQNKSCQGILKACMNAKYKIGVTGTFPKDPYDGFIIKSHVGPVVYRYTSKQLIEDEKFATPVIVHGLLLNYLPIEERQQMYINRSNIPSECPELGGKLLDEERDMCRKSDVRRDFICNMVKRTKMNSLVIFSDKKNKYGYSIYTQLKDWTEKNVYYIDGDTNTNTRAQIKQAMEDDTEGNTVIVASIGCFKEGIDIANLWYIFLVETTKSDISIAQLIGRGMRRYKGKDKTVLIDFGDDFTYGDPKKNPRAYKNYLMRHFEERGKIYKERGFPYNVREIDCINKGLFY